MSLASKMICSMQSNLLQKKTSMCNIEQFLSIYWFTCKKIKIWILKYVKLPVKYFNGLITITTEDPCIHYCQANLFEYFILGKSRTNSYQVQDLDTVFSHLSWITIG